MSTDPKKDVIYIDIDDDITSVIEKVKTLVSISMATKFPTRSVFRAKTLPYRSIRHLRRWFISVRSNVLPVSSISI